MKIESKKVRVAASREKVFEYVTDLNNFKNLLPQDRISEWESRKDYCSFKVQGTATIDLQLKDTVAPEKVVLEGGPKSPFPIILEIFLDESGEETEAYQIMNADVNPFLKMMVQKPLSNLFDYIADRLKDQVQ